MSDFWTNPEKAPPPEQLAAYADGELDPAQRAPICAWLTSHPDAAAEVATWRRVRELMQRSVAPEPRPEAWHQCRRGMESALAAARSDPRRAIWRVATVLFATAAAALVFIVAQGGPRPGARDEPLPVAAPEDVLIVSMDPNDARALVVGELPADEPIVLATHEDVTLVWAEPDADGGSPDIWTKQGAAPIIVPPSDANER